jgi:hypothetical protein
MFIIMNMEALFAIGYSFVDGNTGVFIFVASSLMKN